MLVCVCERERGGRACLLGGGGVCESILSLRFFKENVGLWDHQCCDPVSTFELTDRFS
jgi:hypothetical protein